MINKLWIYGTKKPVQRVGVIVLAIGVISSILWMVESGRALEIFFNSYYFPRSYDSFIYHLYLFLIPFGFILSWGYKVILSIKLWIFGNNKNTKPAGIEVMHFKSNEAAFEMACEFMDTDVIHKKPVIALVVAISDDDLKVITVKIADKQPFLTYASTRFAANYPLQPNDFLAAIPYKTEDENGDERWIFVVSSKLNPRYHLKKQMWSIEIDFLKEATNSEKFK